MRLILNRFFTILLLLLPVLSAAQDDRYTGSILFNNGVLKEVNDSIEFSIDVLVDGAALNTRLGIRYVPVIVAGGNSIELPDILVLGENKYNNYTRSYKLLSRRQKKEYIEPYWIMKVEKGVSSQFNYNYSAPYEKWMDEGRLIIYQELIDMRDRRGIIAIAFEDKVQLERRASYRPEPLVNYLEPAPEAKLRHYKGVARLNFQMGRAEILPHYGQNREELAKIDKALGKIAGNPDITIESLFIEGYASPDGNYAANNNLSRNRAYALKNYIADTFYPPLSSREIRISWIAEDWDGLRELVSDSYIREKESVLSIINTGIKEDVKEARLKLLDGGYTYQYMLDELFPKLRRVEYQVDYTVKEYTTEEITAKNIDDYELLNHHELYKLSQVSGTEIEREEILLKIIPSLYPDDVIAVVNASALLIEQGKHHVAANMLEDYTNHNETWNNLGVAYLMMGELSNAAKYLQGALSIGIGEARHNIEELEKKELDDIEMRRYE